MSSKKIKTPLAFPPGTTPLPDNAVWENRFQVKSESSNRLYTIAQNKQKRHWACSCRGWVAHRKCKHLTALGLPCFEKPFEPKRIGG